jgi:hypothetical protein
MFSTGTETSKKLRSKINYREYHRKDLVPENLSTKEFLQFAIIIDYYDHSCSQKYHPRVAKTSNRDGNGGNRVFFGCRLPEFKELSAQYMNSPNVLPMTLSSYSYR